VEKHPLAGRRFRLLGDHIARWEDGVPVVLHKAKTMGVILGVGREDAYQYPVIIVGISGYAPHPICIRVPDRNGDWDTNIELIT
jgi:hypothetical protein